MRLNTLRPGAGARRRRRRVGRGAGSGMGKTCGRGHKGQTSRAGGGPGRGFEGGQMPLQRRLPKVGFRSRRGRFDAELRLDRIAALADVEELTIETLRKQGLIGRRVRRVKVIASGSVDKPLKLSGIRTSKGARAAIEAAGGSVAE